MSRGRRSAKRSRARLHLLKLGRGDARACLEPEFGNGAAEKAGLFLFGFDKQASEALANQQAGQRWQARTGANVGKPGVGGKKFQRRQRFKNVANGELLGRARSDQMKQRILSQDDAVVIRKAGEVRRGQLDPELFFMLG
jgi:hypothetical protein